jgi:hypothetical protein
MDFRFIAFKCGLTAGSLVADILLVVKESRMNDIEQTGNAFNTDQGATDAVS